MAWARYDDELSMNRKVGWLIAQGVYGAAAIGLQVLANTWSRHEGLGGFIPTHQPGLLVGDVKLGRKLAELLERADMFDITEGGWVIHDFDEYSDPNDDGKPASEKKRDISAKRAEIGRLGGLAKAKQTSSKPPSKPLAKAKQTSAPDPDPDPVPDPSADISDDDDSENTPPGPSSSISEAERDHLATTLAEHYATTATINTNRRNWLKGTKANILAERRDELDQCITDGLTDDQAIRRLTSQAEPRVATVHHRPDPYCGDCYGSGWISTGANNTVAPCPCITAGTNDELATVHELRKGTA